MVDGICRQTTENFLERTKDKKIVLWGAVETNVKR